MKSINKILILFIFLMFLAFFAVWEFLQTQWVAEKISVVATKYAKEVLNSDVEFDSMEFKLYPPGADLKNVYIKGEKFDTAFEAEINSLGIYFNPLDVFNTSFQINELLIEDGSVEIDIKPSKKKKKNEKIDLAKTFKLLEDIPLKTLTLENFLVDVNDYKLEASKFSLSNLRSYILLKGSMANIDLKQIIGKDIVLDEVDVKTIINQQKVVFEKGIIRKDLAKVNIVGNIQNYISNKPKYKLSADANLPLRFINDLVDFSKIGSIHKGYGEFKIKTNGKGKKFSTTISANATDVDSDFAYGDKIKALIKINPKHIRFEKFKLNAGKQKMELINPFEFFNFETKKWVEEEVYAKTENLKTNNFLKFLRKNLSLLDGELTGGVRFILGEDFYTFIADEDVVINELVLKPGGTQIFKVQDLKMDVGTFEVRQGVFKMDLVASNGDTTFNLNGEIGKDKFLLSMPSSIVELEKFSPITFFDIAGKGKLSFDLKRMPDKSMKMFFNGDLKNFEFHGYRLDKVLAELVFDFNSSEIAFKKLIGSSNKTSVSALGSINYKTLDVDSMFTVKNLNFTESKRILKKHIGHIKYTSNEIHGVWDLNGKITGKLNPDEINIDGSFNGVNNYFFNESLDTFRFKYLLSEQKLRIKDFVAKKASGKFFSFIEYDLKNNLVDLWLKISKLPLSEITHYSRMPLNLQGQLDGALSLKLKDAKWSGEGQIDLKKASVLTEKYRNSSMKLKLNDSIAQVDINAFGRKILLDSNIHLLDDKKDSQLNLNLNIPNLKKMLGIFSGVDILNSDLEGSVNYKMSSSFSTNDFLIKNVSSHVKKFNLKKYPIVVSYKSDAPEIIVNNSKIEKWDVNIRGRIFYILSKGEGDLSKDYDVTSSLKIDASIIEVFNSIVSSAKGKIRGKLVYQKEGQKENYEALLTSNDLALNTKFLPTGIENAKMKISLEDKNIKIEKFNAQLASGRFTLGGAINLNNVVPDINLRYNFKDAGLSVLKKSNLVFSGNGSLIGKNFPYTLGGDFYIQEFRLVNELADLGTGSGGLIANDIKYLPGTRNKDIEGLLDLNINVITRNPVFIDNSIVDVGFNGNLQVSGGENDPRLSGKIDLAARNNEIKFKNNKFVLGKGNVFFNERNDFKNPELDFQATSTINDYKINVKVLGPVKNFDFELTSEPALSQSDILSLIAFGYTEEVNLTDAERERRTQAGITSLIFDSFKINETLRNEFGLEVGIGTDIVEEETSLLSGRNSEGNADAGNVNSTTKLEVKKQINDAISMSVSSTVGNSNNQKQKVNVIYNINKGVSIEGVYESQQTDDTQTINDDTSIGVDLKIKRPFK